MAKYRVPNWFCWILLHAGIGATFIFSGFSFKETAALLTAGLIWWIDKENIQDWIGPAFITVFFWFLACLNE
jgi:hypothetical protein